MEHLRAGARQLLSAGLASSTKAVYKKALEVFDSFRAQYDLCRTWPVSLSQLEAYISYLFHRGYAYSTTATYVSAIRFQHKLRGLPDSSSCFSVIKILEGYRRSKPSHDTRMPITYEILVEISLKLSSVCNSQFESILFKAAYTLAFFGLFRVGELVFSSAFMADAPLLELDIIQYEPNKSFKVRLRRSKTNQQGVPVIVPIAATGTSVCPVASMNDYLRVRPKNVNCKYLFCHLDGSPLSRYQFGAVLTKVIRTTRYPSAGFKTHSFRIGAATWLAQQGVSYNSIKKMGRWSSDAFLRYIRL